MQIVNKMESSSESNVEDKTVDKEKLASDVDVNENLSKQCNGNTVSFVNRNISESPKLNDNSSLSHENSEVELCPMEENCELHISEGSDIECEGLERNEDSGKPEGENKEKNESCDQSDISEEEIKEKDMKDIKNQTTDSQETTDDDNSESRPEHSSEFKCEEIVNNSEKTEEIIEELCDESASKPDDLETQSENDKSQSDVTKKLQEDVEDDLALNEKDLTEECKQNVNGETTKDSCVSDEMLRAADSIECEDRNGSSQQNCDVDITTGPSNEEKLTDKKCKGEPLSDSVDDEEGSEASLASRERSASDENERTVEYDTPENVEKEQTETSKDSQTVINSENEHDVNQSIVGEIVLEEKCENGSGVDSTGITESSAAVSETSHSADGSKYKPLAADSEDSVKHVNDDTENTQCEQESINEPEKQTETEVGIIENTGDVNGQSNGIEGEHTAECVKGISGENQRVGDQEDKENNQINTTAETVPVTGTDSHSLTDRTENTSDSAGSSAMQPLSETFTEVSGENAETVSNEIPNVEGKLNNSNQSVQTMDKMIDTASTQTVPKESQDQSSETNTQQVGSVYTQTADQTVECEHKETETDSLEEANKTEVCDKETSVSHPERTESSVQTESESSSVSEAGESSKMEEDTAKANQPIEPTNLEQGSQTDPQETISLMTQTEDLKTEKEQALEEETGMLKDQLSEAKKMIQCLQAELVKTKAHSNYTVTTLQCQLKKSQEAQRSQRCQSDRQMGEVLAHLLFLEGQLKKDKTHIKHLLKQKDDIIQKQNIDIEDLKTTNQRLIEAVREHYSRKGKNGLSRDHHDSIQGADAEVPCSPKVKEKVKNRGAFGSMKDILWKHRSSLDLSEAGMEIQGNLKKGRQYSSQENLFSLGRKNKEARENRDKKCKSIAGYPDHSLDYLIPEESELRDISLHGSNSSITKNQRSGRNVSWGSDISDVNISYDDNGHLMATSPTQMMSAGSMPALNKNSNLDLVTKDRPHSISSIESLSRENCSSIPGTPKMEERVPHTVSQESSNPFKNLKTILKRKGSKNKNKKRTVSLSQSAKPEYEEAMKKHFEKYEMS